MSQQTIAAAVTPQLRDRIDGMYKRDCWGASALVVVLWLTVIFVMLAVRGLMPPSVEIVCWISAAILLLFNTAAIVAMVRHYADDKDHIYGIDIHHLDAGR
jgi:hypothetical protein